MTDIPNLLEVLKTGTISGAINGAKAYFIFFPIFWAFRHAPGSKKNNLRRTLGDLYSKFRQPQ